MLSRLKTSLKKPISILNRNLPSTTIGIRREDGVQWERRAPFTPNQISTLIEHNPEVKIFVQPSKQRVFTEKEYEEAGAIISEDISDCQTIIGVKQVPVNQLHNNKTYVFFSHTIKAQEAQMDLLDACLEKNIRLIDYEKIQEKGVGQRLVAFGKWAGVVGAIDILNGLGQRLFAKGLDTPFLKIARAHNNTGVDNYFKYLRNSIAPEISDNLASKLEQPLIVIFTGNGNVSKGAQEVFQQLGTEFIRPDQLENIAKNGDKSKIYGCIIEAQDHIFHKNGQVFTWEDYNVNPQNYKSIFSEKFLPFCNVLINGLVWHPGQPRLITNNDLENRSIVENLMAVADISADPNGSLEFMSDCTSLDVPFNMYDLDQKAVSDDLKIENGFLFCSVDNMPTQVAKEATAWFGDGMVPLISSILKASDRDVLFEDLGNNGVGLEISQAMITSENKLTPRFEYISDLLGLGLFF